MEFFTDLEPEIVGCNRYEQIVKLVSAKFEKKKCEINFEGALSIFYVLLLLNSQKTNE